MPLGMIESRKVTQYFEYLLNISADIQIRSVLRWNPGQIHR